MFPAKTRNLMHTEHISIEVFQWIKRSSLQ